MGIGAKGAWEGSLVIPKVVRANGEDAWSGTTGRQTTSEGSPERATAAGRKWR
jgi:hypothetical protein